MTASIRLAIINKWQLVEPNLAAGGMAVQATSMRSWHTSLWVLQWHHGLASGLPCVAGVTVCVSCSVPGCAAWCWDRPHAAGGAHRRGNHVGPGPGAGRQHQAAQPRAAAFWWRGGGPAPHWTAAVHMLLRHVAWELPGTSSLLHCCRLW